MIGIGIPMSQSNIPRMIQPSVAAGNPPGKNPARARDNLAGAISFLRQRRLRSVEGAAVDDVLQRFAALEGFHLAQHRRHQRPG